MAPRSRSSNRRQFFKQALTGLGGLTLAGSVPLLLSKSAHANRVRRYGVNIECPGAWDTHYHHCTYTEMDLKGLEYTKAGVDFLSPGYSNRNPAPLFTARYREELALKHPFDSDIKLGVGTSNFTSADWSKICILRGLVLEQGHTTSNFLQNTGAVSSYAASYASLISQKLAEDYNQPGVSPRPLHYVQVSSSPAQLFTRAGLLRGYATAVNIPSPEAWAAMTTASPSDLPNDATQSRRQLLNDSVKNITNTLAATPGLLQDSKFTYQNFLASFLNSVTVSSSNYAASDVFNALWNKYEQVVHDEFNFLFQNQELKSRMALSYWFKPPATLDIRKHVRNVAFPFALADFLIQYDLSSWVDIGCPVGDAHNNNDDHFINLTMAFALTRELIRSLGSVTDVGSGKKLIDLTTIVMKSDFDRDPGLYPYSPNARPGSDHGDSVSVLLAGGGIRGGRVVGDVKTGPQALYGGFTGIQFNHPLPIDLNTGKPNINGSRITTSAIFPTVLAAFGMVPPPQQTTEAVAIQAVIKPE